MALYSPVGPIRPVEIDIPFHGSAIKRPNSKKNRNKETLDADDKAGVDTERVPSPFVLRVLGHRKNHMRELMQNSEMYSASTTHSCVEYFIRPGRGSSVDTLG